MSKKSDRMNMICTMAFWIRKNSVVRHRGFSEVLRLQLPWPGKIIT
ncbi:MAG: hypothetical protein ACKVH8_19960 [Pirellulales bacterium]